MKKILQRLFEYKSLSQQEAKQVMLNIGKGVYNLTEITAFMTVYLMRSITIEELQGFREGLLQMASPINLNGFDAIDIVGTGGDGKNTFNISTLSCFIVAGAGKKVAKHGNYGATSVSGASNVLESLGYRFTASADKAKNELEQTGFTFLHAPLFHPALKAVAGIRKEIGFRTFFNMLGPLVNPALPQYSLIGVYSAEMARIYNYLLQKESSSFTIVYGMDGYDEVSLTSDTKLITPQGEEVCSAQQLGKRSVSPSDLHGGNSVDEAAKIFIRILNGEGSWAQHAVVLANASLAIFGSGGYKNYDEAYDAAVESFESGKALQSFNRLMELQ